MRLSVWRAARRRTWLLRAAATAAATLAFAPATRAATTWTGGTGSWTDPSNWSSGVPDDTLAATIVNGGTAQILGEAVTARNLTLGNTTPGSAGNVDDQGSLEITNGLNVGSDVGSTFKMSGGS